MLGLKLECSLVSAFEEREVGVYGNLDIDELLFDSDVFTGAGESWSGLDLSSDFSEGVLRCAGGGVLCEEEL